jgi:hypothetical protein
VILGKGLTDYETKIAHHFAVILLSSGELKWAAKLSHAFKCDINII